MAPIALLLFGLVGVVEPDGPYRLIHADEEVVTWLEDASVQRRGSLVRARTLRVRSAGQAFWLVSEVDCAAGTQGLSSTRNRGDPAPSSFLDGTARQSPIKPYDRYGRALKAALCDGARPYGWAEPAANAEAAVAAWADVSRRGERERPMALLPLDVDATLYLDRETLDGGGPQWDFKVLRVSRQGGGAAVWRDWTRWEIDCERRTADRLSLQPSSGRGDVGAVARDEAPAEPITSGHQAAQALRLICEGDPWRLPAQAGPDTTP